MNSNRFAMWTRKLTQGDLRLVEGEVEAVNQKGETLINGSFVAALPSDPSHRSRRTVSILPAHGQRERAHDRPRPCKRLPANVVRAARVAMLDTLGVTLAGSVEGHRGPCACADRASPLGRGDQDPRHAAACVEDAAFANGTSAHALDYDDVQVSLSGHPSAPILDVTAVSPPWRLLDQGAEVTDDVFVGAAMLRLTSSARW